MPHAHEVRTTARTLHAPPRHLTLPLIAACVAALAWFGATLEEGAFAIIAVGTLLCGLLSLFSGRST